MGRLGVFVGAGISAPAPSGLPTGDRFHGLLLAGCRDAARRYAPHAVTEDGLRLLTTAGRRNILGCIEDCLPAGTTAGVLDCMRVRVPSEAHLLCAVHAADGAPLITINFDNGIELAYALLTGAASLPPEVPAAYHDRLAEWRRRMPARGPLRVVSTPDELARRAGPTGPILVKLRGSVDRGADGTVIPLRPALEDMESTRLDTDRFAALSAVAGCDHLIVTGHSGRDLDCFESLRLLLRPGRFTWAAPGLAPHVVARIAAIDPGQPRADPAEVVLRSWLPELPPWPRGGPGNDFAARFSDWWSGLPPAATAEAYAWMLADAGRYDEPIAIVRGLLPAVDRPGPRLRLADLLTRRGRAADLAEAECILAAALADPRPYPRFYVECRRIQARPDLPAAALLPVLRTATARLGRRDDDVGGRAAVRCIGMISRLIRERSGGPELLPAVRRALALAAIWADHRGLGARQSDLELEIVATEALAALAGGPPPAAGAASRLAAVERAYRHRGDAVGLLRAVTVRGLCGLASGDPAAAADAAARVLCLGAGQEYARLAAELAEELSAGLRRKRSWFDAGSTPPETGGAAGPAAAGEPAAGAATAA